MNYNTRPKIEDYLTLTIADLKRNGLLAPSAFNTGTITWKRGGVEAASIRVDVDTSAASPYVRLKYTCDGSPFEYVARLKYTPSNLNRGGYYYFVCPATGHPCRKLFLVGDRFVSRFAFYAPYATQARSHSERCGLYGFLYATMKYDDMMSERGRKKFYRGKLTRYGRRIDRLAARVSRLSNSGRMLAAALQGASDKKGWGGLD